MNLVRVQQQATLLQQALPQIPAAIYNCRDALLAQGAKLNGLIQSVLDGRLMRVEGTLNCLVQSQLGAAQQLAEQLTSMQLAEQLTSIGIDAAQQLPGIVSLTLRLQSYANFSARLQSNPPHSAAALQPAAAPQPAGPPAYTLIDAHTVADVWREYKEGIAGGPAVEQLERQWRWRWRPAAAQRTAWSWRKTVLDEVERLVVAGLTPADAVAELEAQRGSSTLRSLIDSLVERKRQRG